ncbi:hypothetical protein [Nostocoides japonicum]|uniref:hypothetical protein n=1 Tax=Nostocoides japonicum TaxID=99481 RepID=UPI00065B7650|nr:hypothetical protein [Tetrasphaera japonica]
MACRAGQPEHPVQRRGECGVRQRRLPPPAGSAVYELTAHGYALLPVLDALGDWGSGLPVPDGRPALSATSVLLYVRGCLLRHPDPPAGVFEVQLGERTWTVRTTGSEPVVEPGGPQDSDATLHTDPDTLNELLADPAAFDAALSEATARAAGDLGALRRLLGVARDVRTQPGEDMGRISTGP